MHVLMNIVNVFFGTVRRASWTLGILAILYFSQRPGDLLAIIRGILHNILVPVFHELVTALFGAVGPIFPSLLALLAIFYGFKVMLRKPSSRKK